jgi:nucleoid-associated protein YgaU
VARRRSSQIHPIQESVRAPGGGDLGIFGDLFGKKEKPRADFSNVRSGASSTALTPGVGEPETNAGSPTTGRTYVVVSGDSLSGIAKRQYGDARKWPRIYEANRNIIKDPDLIYPGQELRIPEA